MKKILFVCLIYLSIPSLGQVNIDSLKQVWNDLDQPDTIRLKAIRKVAWDGYLISQPDSAFYYAQMLYDYAKSKGLKKQMASALRIQQDSFWLRGDYATAIEYGIRSLALFQEIGNKKGIAMCLHSLGNSYLDLGDYARSIGYFTRSLTISEEIELIGNVAFCLQKIGIIHAKQRDYAGAIDYLTRSLNIREEIGDKNAIGLSLISLGNIYNDQGDYDKALDNFTRSLNIAEDLGYKFRIAVALNHIGGIYKQQGDYIQALDHYTRSLMIGEEIGAKNLIAFSLNGIGINYKEQGDSAANFGNIELSKYKYREAINYSNRSLSIGQESGNTEVTEESSNTLYEVYQATRQYQLALEMHKLYMAIRDSIASEKNQKEVIRQEYKYAYEKQKLADDLTHQASLNKETNQRIALYFILGLLVLFAAYVYRAWRIRRNLSKKIQLSYSQLEELDDYKESMTAMIIHDFKNSLNTVISFSEDTPTKSRLQGINQAGKFMLNLVLNMLDVQKFETTSVKLSLKDYQVSKVINHSIEQLGYLFDQKSIELDYNQKEALFIKIDYELITRSIVNILSNAIKFAPNNGKIVINVDQKEDTVRISIQDNGPGIPEDKIDQVFDKYSQINAIKSGSVRSTGIGLTFCKMVVEAHGGNIGVASSEGEGANFYFTLPIIENIEGQNTPIEKIDIPHDEIIVLSDKEKTMLEPYFKELEKWEVYDYSEVVAIIDKIDGEGNQNIISWKERMIKSLHNGNQEQFKELTSLLIELE